MEICMEVNRNPHIKLPGLKHGPTLDENHDSITHERGQPSNRVHETICRFREEAFDGRRRRFSPRLHSRQSLFLARTFLLVVGLISDKSCRRYHMALWNVTLMYSTVGERRSYRGEGRCRSEQSNGKALQQDPQGARPWLFIKTTFSGPKVMLTFTD